MLEQSDGTIGINVTYLNENQTFSPTQITAMLFTKLKHTAEIALGIKVADVVIGVSIQNTFCDESIHIDNFRYPAFMMMLKDMP